MGTYRDEADRLNRPNHYSHDSLGDPRRCKEDHNHPDREIHPALKALVEWAAYGVIFGLLFLFFLGVYVLADLVF